MTSERLINEIDAITANNRQHVRDVNELLCDIRNYLKKIENQESTSYEQGAENAWELARKICSSPSYDGFTLSQLNSIFNNTTRVDIITSRTYQDAVTELKAYEQKKKEEAEKPVVGDVVEVRYKNWSSIKKGILLGENCNAYSVKFNEYDFPQTISKENYSLKKTGEHFDIQGMMDSLED